MILALEDVYDNPDPRIWTHYVCLCCFLEWKYPKDVPYVHACHGRNVGPVTWAYSSDG